MGGSGSCSRPDHPHLWRWAPVLDVVDDLDELVDDLDELVADLAAELVAEVLGEDPPVPV